MPGTTNRTRQVATKTAGAHCSTSPAPDTTGPGSRGSQQRYSPRREARQHSLGLAIGREKQTYSSGELLACATNTKTALDKAGFRRASELIPGEARQIHAAFKEPALRENK